jgi:DNA-binding PadR family transcriptional regulator
VDRDSPGSPQDASRSSSPARPPSPGAPPLTPAVFHILLALADGPLHGYAIMRGVERTAGPELRMGPGTVYGSLQRMEEAGLVAEAEGTGGERRRTFALTAAGRQALAVEAARLVRLADLVRARRLVPGEA